MYEDAFTQTGKKKINANEFRESNQPCHNTYLILHVVLITLDENIDEDLLYEQFVAIDTNNVIALDPPLIILQSFRTVSFHFRILRPISCLTSSSRWKRISPQRRFLMLRDFISRTQNAPSTKCVK